MPQNTQPSFAEVIRDTDRSAVHLEMRDAYGDNERFAAWRHGARINWDDRATWWRGFHDQIAEAAARGVSIRRARIVSEPVSEYIRWEHYVTRANVSAGEQVRWLPRRLASDLALPGNDYWLFDDRLARIHHFAGDGSLVADEFSTEPAVLKLFAASFEAVWERGIPHEEYTV
ncbi:DUF6879 family protein [Streptomyces halobius]|uniref:DUF6879 domain-containing protein n=1 Tax=Streptomyces halobius TaxID=2879846 RepID=A0ABY4MD73_9ACTN|nr:DUF6879 family protein [Streptomyces halobius]UQA95267.1 hypothetical protein K9S39_28490 [Streptomyces halobius]